jgi:CTP synthase (UTP-ammonia lyase)
LTLTTLARDTRVMRKVRVGIIGDFDRTKHSHWATDAALYYASARLGAEVEPRWIPTPTVDEDVRVLADCDGVWGAPGSPYRSMSGSLKGIEYARTRGVPYLGTCAGFQYAVIEFSRNVLGITDADSAENTSASANIVIRPVYCATEPQSVPRLAGPGVARAVPGTRVATLCGVGERAEEYFCSFEVSPDFVRAWEAAGMVVAATGQAGEMRALELRGHPFFLATLFQPQLSSSREHPHPLIEGFLQACRSRALTT